MAKKKEEIKTNNDVFDSLDKMIQSQFEDEVLDLSKEDTKVKTWYDSGVYALNYTVSKNLMHGYPSGRITSLSGLSGTGKSLMAAVGMRDPSIDMVIILETEGGGHADELIEFAGVDRKKVRILKANTFSNYRINKKNNDIEEITDNKFPKTKDTDQYLYKEGATRQLKRLVQALEFNPKMREAKIYIVLDSLGNLQSVRELSGTSDMGKRATEIGNFFRTFDVAFEKSNIAFVFTNKLYTNLGNPYDPWKETGGENAIYNPSVSVRFTETSITDDVSDKDMKEEKERRKTSLGSSLKTIRATVTKSRFGTEGRNAWFLLDFSVGPVRLSGLFTLLKDFGIIQGNRTYTISGWNDDKSFYKKDFINLVMEKEEENIKIFQELLEKREEEMKEERRNLQANDLTEVEETSEDENEFGDMLKAMERESD
ncbi:MAG: hypothetical protein ACOC1O_00990 [bacterium]